MHAHTHTCLSHPTFIVTLFHHYHLNTHIKTPMSTPVSHLQHLNRAPSVTTITHTHTFHTFMHSDPILYWPISASSTSALWRCPVPWYTRPMPTTAATCTLCGTSSSVEVGGSRAGIWMLSRRVIDMAIVPSLAAETPSKSPMLVMSWFWGRKWKKSQTLLFVVNYQIQTFIKVQLMQMFKLWTVTLTGQ